mgnify:CR=1 FL=1
MERAAPPPLFCRVGERSSRSGTRMEAASVLHPRPSRNDAGSAWLILASCARLRRARCRDNPSGCFAGRDFAGFKPIDRAQGFHGPVAADANCVPHDFAKGAFAQLLDGQVFDHRGLSAAQSAAGAQHLLRELSFPCLKIGKAFAIIHFGHMLSFTIAKVCPPRSILPRCIPDAIAGVAMDLIWGGNAPFSRSERLFIV